MLTWKDVSSYSQRDTERIPSTFETYAGPFRLTVTRHIGLSPTSWRLRIDPGIASVDLDGNLTVEEAQQKLTEYTRVLLRRSLAALE